VIQVLPSTPMSTSTIHESSPRSLFERRTFTTLVRAMHAERRHAVAASRLTVGDLDRQPDTALAWVYGAYAAVLGRLPDPSGLATHEALLRGGWAPEKLVSRLVASDEAVGTAVDASTHLHHVFVTGAYLLALGRRPDMGGLHTHSEALRSGTDHDDVLNALLRSDEARSQLRFPPTPPTYDEHLARSVQQTVIGSVDPDVERVLVSGRRAGRSVTWMIWTTLRRRAGRRTLVRTLPGAWWLAHRARRHAEVTLPVAALESTTEWNWRVQRRLMDDVATLAREVAEVQSASRG
jgi:hypothetical protein